MTRDEAIERCINRETRNREVLFVNDPRDEGRETCYGISRRYNSSWPGWDVYDKYGVSRPDLLEPHVVAFYRRIWSHFRCSLLPDELAPEVFDFAVTSWDDAAKCLQWLVDAEPDGVIGPRTIRAVACVIDVHMLVAAYRGARARHYFELSKRDSSQMAFLKGWLNRTWED